MNSSAKDKSHQKPKDNEAIARYIGLHYHISDDPRLLNNTIFHFIRQYSLNLLPKHRNVALCFEHFYTDSICKSLKLYNTKVKKGNLPEHCLVLNLKFLSINAHQFIGNICYFSRTSKADLVNILLTIIGDLFKCGLRVVLTISSGRFELLSILCAGQSGNFLSFADGVYKWRVHNHQPIIHMFDPSWLMRKLRADFERNDMVFHYKGNTKTASFNDVLLLKEVPILSAVFTDENYARGVLGTSAAAKIFSKTVSQAVKEVNEFNPKLPMHDGTEFLLLIFDKLIDSFNSTAEYQWNRKGMFKHPVKMHSSHWKLWNNSRLLLKTITFNYKTKSSKRRKKANKEIFPADYEYVNPEYPCALFQVNNKEEVRKLFAELKQRFSSTEENFSEILKHVEMMEPKCLELVERGSTFDVVYQLVTKNFGPFIENPKKPFEGVDISDQITKDFQILDQNIIQLWDVSIVALEDVCNRLLRHHIHHVSTNIMNCDMIHYFVSKIQQTEGILHQMLVADQKSDTLIDLDMALYAFREEANIVCNNEKRLL